MARVNTPRRSVARPHRRRKYITVIIGVLHLLAEEQFTVDYLLAIVQDDRADAKFYFIYATRVSLGM